VSDSIDRKKAASGLLNIKQTCRPSLVHDNEAARSIAETAQVCL
jgi:hypothetical protein